MNPFRSPRFPGYVCILAGSKVMDVGWQLLVPLRPGAGILPVIFCIMLIIAGTAITFGGVWYAENVGG